MKKIAFFILAWLFLIGLVACSSSFSEDTESETTGATGSTTVSMFIPDYQKMSRSSRAIAPQTKKVRLSYLKNGTYKVIKSIALGDGTYTDVADGNDSTLPGKKWTAEFTGVPVKTYIEDELKVELINEDGSQIYSSGTNTKVVTVEKDETVSGMDFFTIPTEPIVTGTIEAGEMKFFKFSMLQGFPYEFSLTASEVEGVTNYPTIFVFDSTGKFEESKGEYTGTIAFPTKDKNTVYYIGLYAPTGKVILVTVSAAIDDSSTTGVLFYDFDNNAPSGISVTSAAELYKNDYYFGNNKSRFGRVNVSSTEKTFEVALPGTRLENYTLTFKYLPDFVVTGATLTATPEDGMATNLLEGVNDFDNQWRTASVEVPAAATKVIFAASAPSSSNIKFNALFIDDIALVKDVPPAPSPSSITLPAASTEEYLKSSTDVQVTDDSVKAALQEAFCYYLDSPADASNTQKMKAIHDYIVANLCYDKAIIRDKTLNGTTGHEQDAVSVLSNKTAVCEGYANLTAAMARGAGIPAKVIVSDKMEHAWNNVYIDGTWLFIDTCWDDVVVNDENTDKEEYPYKINYEYFLKTSMNGVKGDHYEFDVAERTLSLDDGSCEKSE